MLAPAFALVGPSTAGKLQFNITDKGLRARVSAFTAVLHTWNQRLDFHPHIHCLVPGGGLDAHGQYVRVKNERFLRYLPHLQVMATKQVMAVRERRPSSVRDNEAD